jgi:ferritin
MSPTSSALMRNSLNCHHKSAKRACQIGISRPSVQHILKHAKWKVYIQVLLHATNEDNPQRRVQYCEWFQQKAHEDEEFVSKIVEAD